MEFRFKRNRTDKVSREDALSALIKAAEMSNYSAFGKRDFDKANLGISSSTIRNVFGSWSAAIDALRDSLREQGKQLKARSRAQISEQDLFLEMERVWRKVGHRPSRDEWENANPQYSYGTYRNRFGGWQSACLRFIEHQTGERIDVLESGLESTAESRSDSQTKPNTSGRRRNPSDRLRLQVLDRDGYRCVLCGNTPADDRSVRLHLDHLVPYSKGGETTLENLRTLCALCNLGRSNSVEIGIGE